jgi:integrase
MPKLVEQALTDSVVRSAKPKEQRYDIFDARLTGLGVRISAKGTKSFFVMRRNKGKMTRITLGQYPKLSLSDARVIAAEKLAQLAGGKLEKSKNNSTFAQVYHEWIEIDQAQNRTLRQVKSAMELHVIPTIGNRKFSQIERSDVYDIVERLVLDGKPTQANRVLSHVKRMFAWAEESGAISQNPVAKLKKLAREVGRHRVLSRNELSSIALATVQLEPTFRQYFRLLLYLCQRRDEVAGIRRGEVDLEEATWIIPAGRTKNGNPHEVQLPTQAVELLKECLSERDTELIFPAASSRSDGPLKPISGFSSMKRTLDKLSGVADWHLHDIRRSFATHTTERLGVSPAVADKVLAHKTGVITGVAAIYNRAELKRERRVALQKWADWIDDLVRMAERDSPVIEVDGSMAHPERCQLSDHTGTQQTPQREAGGASEMGGSAR